MTKPMQAECGALAAQSIPDVLFDGHAVLQALTEDARKRTSPENVADVLDAVVRLMRAAPAPDIERDAARYRWLRDMDMLSAPSVDLAEACATKTGSALDAAIDRIMCALSAKGAEQ